MAVRRISQLDPVLSALNEAGDVLSPEEIYDEIVWFVRNNPTLSGYLMEVSEFHGSGPNLPSYYLSKQFDLSSLITIISASITGSLDELYERSDYECSSVVSCSPSAMTMYRNIDYNGDNVFHGDVEFHRDVVITAEQRFPRDTAPSAVMTTGNEARTPSDVIFDVQVPSRFLYPINACSMSAWWADLAEVYDADGWYTPGTLVQFGGEREITIATTEVNAVVTTNPAFTLNTGNHSNYSCPVAIAMTGRTPVLVSGEVKKFDRIMLDSNCPGTGIVAEKNIDEKYIIAVALESNSDPSPKCVLCATRFKI